MIAFLFMFGVIFAFEHFSLPICAFIHSHSPFFRCRMFLWLAAFLVVVLFFLFRASVWWFNRRCPFCDIAAGKKAARVVFENDEVLAFHDIRPCGEVHFLVVPRRHIDSVYNVTEATLLQRMEQAAQKVLQTLGKQHSDNVEMVFVRPPFNTVLHLHM
jgi:histidine triad (HIT) family protein